MFGAVTPAELADAVTLAVRAAVDAGELSADVTSGPVEVKVERPRNKDHGDYATSVAMIIAKAAGTSPRDVAEVLRRRLLDVEGISGVEVAGPGFLNITLAAASQGALARTIVETGASYGQQQALRGRRINLEFVSANPTGPLHLGHARWAAVGDALGRVLSASGAEVVREF